MTTITESSKPREPANPLAVQLRRELEEGAKRKLSTQDVVAEAMTEVWNKIASQNLPSRKTGD